MKTILQKIHPYTWKLIILFTLIIATLIAISVYGHKKQVELSSKINELSTHIAILEGTLASSSASLAGAIQKTHDTLADELNAEKQNVATIGNQVGTIGQQVGSISGTVNTLEKLSKTDPELLNKYSKIYFLNENYVPERLAQVDQAYVYSNTRAEQVHSSVYPYLKKMLDEAKAVGVTIYVKSAYRPFDEQKALNSQYTIVYGAEKANQFSAVQGYSEHQLGTTADFITPGLGGELDGFEKTTAYTWMKQNAYKYGFVISYPENNSFYIFEPWHWRFVGVKLATDLKNQGKNFYDLEQRAIDEYLVNIFD